MLPQRGSMTEGGLRSHGRSPCSLGGAPCARLQRRSREEGRWPPGAGDGSTRETQGGAPPAPSSLGESQGEAGRSACNASRAAPRQGFWGWGRRLRDSLDPHGTGTGRPPCREITAALGGAGAGGGRSKSLGCRGTWPAGSDRATTGSMRRSAIRRWMHLLHPISPTEAWRSTPSPC